MTVKTISMMVARLVALTLLLFFLFSIDFLGLRLDKPLLASPLSQLLMSFLDVIVLSYPIIRSRWTGWRLAATIFLVFYGVTIFLSQIETVVFLQYLKDVVPVQETSRLFLNGAVMAAVFAPLSVWIHGKMKSAEMVEQVNSAVNMSLSRWIWKLALIGVIYVVVYLAFGLFVAMPIGGESFRQFYGNLQMPGWFLPFQIVRGLLWAALAIPVIRMMKGRLWEAGLAVALLYSVLMASLLLPSNEYMPDQVRMAHLIEVSSSNFLFGWIVVGILKPLHRSK